MKKPIRIGSRSSPLALWQAERVKAALESKQYRVELSLINSSGDTNLTSPLYEMGIVGIFTKTLDAAMLKGDIDVAVHSMKDVPTRLAEGIIQAAVLERGDVRDCLVYKDPYTPEVPCTIATGSLRRQAQWKRRYPTHRLENIRGNLQLRLQKLEQTTHWNGAVFAVAGLHRLGLLPPTALYLDWMIPAPAQGSIMAVCRDDNPFTFEALSSVNHQPTEICTAIERQFLKTLEGGCTAPIGALAVQSGETINFVGTLLHPDGSQSIDIKRKISLSDSHQAGQRLAHEVLRGGGESLIKSFQ